MNRREEVEAEAADWLARVDRGLDSQEETAFQRWKAGATEHRIVFLQLQETWRRADRIAALRQPSLQPSLPGRRLSMRLPLAAMAIAAVLVLCVCVGLVFLETRKASDESFETAIGMQRSLSLTDGTHIQLNTNTLIHTSMSSGARTVKLDRGQAYFEVVHDAHRPFVVIAGNRRITDLGTKFSVLRDGDRVEVVVREGRVRIDLIGEDPANEKSMPVLAERNTVVIARNVETLVAVKQPRDIDNELLWRSGMLVFNQESLADVAEQMNRYNVRKIVVTGPARDILIGGSFRSDNIEGFQQLLRDGFGLKIVENDNNIMISN